MMGPSKRSLLRMLEREREACAAERRLLLGTIAELAGKPQASYEPRTVVERPKADDPHPEFAELVEL